MGETCPKCGREAIDVSVIDMRDNGGELAKDYKHEKSDCGLFVTDSCMVIQE